MVQASLLATLTLTGQVRVWHVFLLAASLGVINAFDMPARQSFVIDLVGQQKEDLANAIALNSIMVNGARLIGPFLAGLTVAALGEGTCFLLNALSFMSIPGGLCCIITSAIFARKLPTIRRMIHA